MDKNIKTIIKKLILSFFVSFAVFNIADLESGNILLLVVFGMCYVLLSASAVTSDNSHKRTSVISAILAGIITVLYIAGDYNHLTGVLENRIFVAVYIALTAAGLITMFFYSLRYAINFLSDNDRINRLLADKKKTK